MLSILLLSIGIFARDLGPYNLSRVLSPEWNTVNPMGDDEFRLKTQQEHEEMRRNLNYTNYPFNVRATMGMYQRGYGKVRLSVITDSPTQPSGLQWQYSKQFAYMWKNHYLHSSIVDVIPGTPTNFMIDNNRVSITIPEENKATRGIFFADPCFTGASCCCKYAKDRWIFNRHTDMLNALSDNNDIDFWYVGGDNFYDNTDYWTNQFFGALNTNTKSKMSGMVLGNHDYWLYSNPGSGNSGDQLGIGMTQYYAQDTLASVVLNNGEPYDWSINPSGKYNWAPPPVADKNGIWWFKIGNLGILGYSGAYKWETYQPYLDQMCTQFANDDGVKYVIVLSHWDALTNGYGVQWEMDAPSFVKKMKDMSSCSAFKYRVKYVDGHDHTNRLYDDGFKIGANGYDSGGYWGAVGQLYIKTDDSGRLWAYYLEFSNGPDSQFDQLLSCVKSNHLEGCLKNPAVTLWFDSGPPLDPSCYDMLDHNCVYKGQSATCGDCIAWLEANNGMTWEQAYGQVSQECGKTCSCDVGPTPEPTSPPPTPHGIPCDVMLQKTACDQDGCYTCGQRIDYLENSMGETPAQAYAQVAQEFPDVCVCNNPPKAHEIATI